jgi:hypothetical protein
MEDFKMSLFGDIAGGLMKSVFGGGDGLGKLLGGAFKTFAGDLMGGKGLDAAFEDTFKAFTKDLVHTGTEGAAKAGEMGSDAIKKAAAGLIK